MFGFFRKKDKEGKRVSCNHKKLIGRRIEWFAIPGGTPQGCYKCGKIFIPDIPRVIKSPSGVGLYVCRDCLSSVKCDLCSARINNEKDMYIAECLYCNNYLLLCPHCAKKKLFIDFSNSSDPEEVISKIYSIVNELMDMNKNRRTKSFWANVFKKKKKPNLEQLFPLIMNINMYFSEDMGSDFYYDDFDNEDWWMN